MKRTDKTTMGGDNERFQTTRWSEIQDVHTSNGLGEAEIIEKLLGRYWKPVYCYLRRKGYKNEQAKDLTQGFFHEIVLGRGLIQKSDKTKGRFRAFMLVALDRYVMDVHRYEAAKKRTPSGLITELDTSEMNLPLEHSSVEPEQVFYYAWAANLLNEVMAKVRDEYYMSDKASYWEVFRAKVLTPIFENVEAASLAEICRKYGIDTESKASNIILTVKRRFKSVLRRFLRQLVNSDAEVDEELADLFRTLSKGSAN